ncbi:glucosamine-6-phosphate deaminase [Brachybacterium saurashtrense]|uniref:Glucosamine-6-phosphate deaminase n=1 Tax=Brachybacterium saurashtrense TaxID=556288 RepID=A0A345YLT5_9MICO|nr:glucosamine-6-phosphate deaminase [Brachybacterium saurashtrense]AXK44887.1 glucosamine-6-phosphate deaminase [Brachybacterium saurashtrense]RRR20832.1 glucosamine-6-phosphate deaminase [Brachybacterium saurashtrense]
MEIHIVEDGATGAEVVADQFARTLREAGPRGAVLGLATGSSPVPAYTELIRRHREEGLSFAGSRAFLLDEYVGLPAGHPQSYHHFIRENFTSHVDIDDAAVVSPDGTAADPVAEAASYDRRLVEAGGVDLQILGIGSNGHIAFNEPGSSLASRTRVVGLTRSTIEDNSRYFASAADVPVRALSQGLGTILEARRIVLTATGAQKAEAVAQLAEGAISARWPATVLQLHPDVVVVVDEAAASRLELAEYYRYSRRLETENPLTPVA